MNNSIAADRRSSILQMIPVMLCFFAMGFVDLVGTASNYVQKDLGLTIRRQISFLRWYSSGFLYFRCLPECS